MHYVSAEDRKQLIAWVEDLETTKAPQIQTQLSDETEAGVVGYCCLGRLCVVVGEKFLPTNPYPPEGLAGLSAEDFERYSELNDEAGMSFIDIAKAVRQDFNLGIEPGITKEDHNA
jgi:hypothetical protein